MPQESNAESIFFAASESATGRGWTAECHVSLLETGTPQSGCSCGRDGGVDRLGRRPGRRRVGTGECKLPAWLGRATTRSCIDRGGRRPQTTRRRHAVRDVSPMNEPRTSNAASIWRTWETRTLALDAGQSAHLGLHGTARHPRVAGHSHGKTLQTVSWRICRPILCKSGR